MKRKVAISLITIILIAFLGNFLFVQASEGFQIDEDESLEELYKSSTPDNYNQLIESGTTGTNGKKPQQNVPVQPKPDLLSFITRLLCKVVVALTDLINNVVSKILTGGNEQVTIQKIVTNKYDLLNLKFLVNPFETSSANDKSVLDPLSKNAGIWFVAIRNLALVGSVVTLIYTGIRLATATVAEGKANYKKILFSWFEGISILLMLHFFIIAIIYTSNWMVDVLQNAINIDPNMMTAEQQIMDGINTYLDEATQSHTIFFYTILFIMFSYYEAKFLFLYLWRLLRVMFYIIISPLVCLTFPIDKIGDGRAQGFNHWLLEITIATFMQPIHLLIYVIIIYSMGEIIVRNPILGIIFLASISHAEHTFKSVLKLKPTVGKGLSDFKLGEVVK